MNKVYRNNTIEGLKDLASYDFQKTAWFENDKGLWSSFEDDVEAVFIDSGLEYFLENNEVVFGVDADKALRELLKSCHAIPDDRNDIKFVHSQEMAEIRKMAKKCLYLIMAYDGSESTVELVDSKMVKMNISFPDRDSL